MRAVEAMALVAGHVDEELLKRNEYLAAENEILRSKIKGRLRLKDSERIRLAKLGEKLGRKALEGVAAIVKPETGQKFWPGTVAWWPKNTTVRRAGGDRDRAVPERPRRSRPSS